MLCFLFSCIVRDITVLPTPIDPSEFRVCILIHFQLRVVFAGDFYYTVFPPRVPSVRMSQSIGNAGDVRQRRRAVMLQQMKDHNNNHDGTADDQQRTQKRLQESFRHETYTKLGMALVLLVVVIVGATLHLRNMRRRGGSHEVLPPRTIITLVPRNVDIEQNLPTVVMGYGTYSSQSDG